MYLPLGLRVLNKINSIMKDEMNAIGAQEVSLPILHPADIWQQTGRWYDIKDEMFRLKDRTGRDMCLGMTHEEIMTWLASREIRSYRDLPQVWYQIQTKMRDEARPKSGVLRTREFTMKDSYSFDVDEAGLDVNYDMHAVAYHRIFSRCGLRFYQVESDAGMMGGAVAHEFMAPSPAGEDNIILCDNCSYTANVEVAVSAPDLVEENNWNYEEIHTPNKRTINEVADFLSLDRQYFIKCILFMTSDKPIMVLVRGDQEVHEKKLMKIIGPFRPAAKDEVIEILGIESGFIGPMNQKVSILADHSIKTGSYITGANKSDFHLKGVRPHVHFSAEWHDLHEAKQGDPCPKCKTLMRSEKAIEIGNIFKLGTKYSKALNAVYLDKDGIEQPIIMGSYGIGPARIAAAAIEQNNDKDGIIWPKSIAPFAVEIIPLNMKDSRTVEAAESIYRDINDAGIEVLLDDRDERPGVKFKDADLIGIPVHVVIGEKNLKDNNIEIKVRSTKSIIKVSLDCAVGEIVKTFNEI
jgi:prolyl-tRNA synthetase